ncbi:MAG: DUF58 domain-containing protein [Candidatus Carbobacillus sp.]|nr:DUF58 domain-containing protein [Candidatus Carbobacillus sp.]
MNQVLSHIRQEVFTLVGTLFLVLSLGYRNIVMFWIAILFYIWMPLSRHMTEKVLQKLTVETFFNRIGIFPEEEAELVVDIKNGARFSPVRATIEFDLDEGMLLQVSDLFQVRTTKLLGVRRYAFDVYLASGEHVRIHLPALAQKRGVYRLFQAHIKINDRFGMLTLGRALDVKGMILVYPALKLIAGHRSFVSGFSGRKKAPRLLLPDPFYIRGIRPYQAGDSLRALDMKRSAQMNRLMTRMYESTSDEHLMVAVNIQTHPNPFVQNDALFEDVLRYTASWMLDSERLKIWQTIFMNVRQGKKAWTRFDLNPGSGGTGGMRRVLSFLARLQHTRPTRFAAVLKALEKDIKPSMHLVVISSWLDEEMINVLYVLKRKGAMIYTLQIETGIIRPLFDGQLMTHAKRFYQATASSERM